ncbi:MAG: Ig-like domain-containing protein [Bacteroidia bacterium]|nr:Ig-like domain-containing protein [Bacteroidia bacterium]
MKYISAYTPKISSGSMALMGFLAVVVLNCAQPASPMGGARDEVPPEVVKTIPENQTLNFSGDEVKIYFSEPIRPPAFDKEIFISPFMKRPKIIRSDNAKKITIKFAEDLRPQTTYVITLTEIKDNTEGNSIKESFTLAFSTGDVLDSMELKGKVFAQEESKPVKDMVLMIFDADSIRKNDFKGKRPAYLTKASESGDFAFKYLRDARFKIYGVVDKDQSNSYSQDTEVIAVSEDSLAVFSRDSADQAINKLYAFLPDTFPPRLLNYVWWNAHTISCRFNENLRLDSLKVIMTDTLNQDTAYLEKFSWLGGTDRELVLHTTRANREWSQIHFSGLSDSLKNRMDTVLRVSEARKKTLENPLLAKPETDLENEAWRVFSHRIYTEADSGLIFLSDTSRTDSVRKTFSLTIESKGPTLFLRPAEKIDPQIPYILNIEGDYFQSFDTTKTDTVYRYPLKWFDPLEYGTIEGVVKYDTTYNGPIVLQFVNKGGKVVRSATDTTFAFKLLPPEAYTIRVILDEDGNGVLSPGNLWPFRLPEKIYEDNTPLTIRANWDFEDHIVQIGEKKAAPQASGETKPGAPPTPAGNRPPGITPVPGGRGRQ